MKYLKMTTAVFMLMGGVSFCFASLEAGKEEDKQKDVEVREKSINPFKKPFFDFKKLKENPYLYWDKTEKRLEGTDPDGFSKLFFSLSSEQRKNLTVEIRLDNNASSEDRKFLRKYGLRKKGETVQLQGKEVDAFIKQWKGHPELGIYMLAPQIAPATQWFRGHEDFDFFLRKGDVVFARGRGKETVFNAATGDRLIHDLGTGEVTVTGKGLTRKMIDILPEDQVVSVNALKEFQSTLDEKRISYTIDGESLKMENVPVGDLAFGFMTSGGIEYMKFPDTALQPGN
ncbi:MAG: hypothetical protein JSS34_00960 [Proteobacteria bacterium]|nr:hypothetical protein [Pseudomonadota bacterium]